MRYPHGLSNDTRSLPPPMTESKNQNRVDGNGLWHGFVQLWILLSLVTFFIIRVLGSHTVQRLLNVLQRQHRV